MSHRTLIRGGHVLTVDPALGDLPNGDVLIEDDRIVAVQPEISADAEVLDAAGQIVIPGFVDTHRHTWEAAIRNVAPNATLDDYFVEILDTFAPHYRPEDVYNSNLAGALECHSGRLVHCTSPRKTNALFRALLDHLEWRYPHAQFTKVYVVVDNYGIHKAKAVARWLVAHPRFKLLFLPTYCPRANPLERAFGDVHDKCTRNHQGKRLEDLVWDVERHLSTNGPWPYHLSQLYYTPEVTAAVERISHEQQLPQAA